MNRDRARRHQQVVEWNDSRVDFEGPFRIDQLIAAQVAATPEAPAVVCDEGRDGGSLTYAGLQQRARCLARRLRSHGVGPEVLVALAAERSLEMVVGLVAILEAGGAYLPLDPDYPEERLACMLQDARPPVIVYQEHLGEIVSRLSRRGFEAGSRLRLVALTPEPESEGGETTGSSAALPWAAPPASPDNLIYTLFTSGSTGRPKGAMNSHRAVANRLLWMQQAYGLNSSDRVLQKTPIGFDVSAWELFWPLITGATLVLARPGGHLDPAYLVDLIAAQKVTTLHFVPSLLRLFLERRDLHRCTSIRRVIASGEALPPDLVERFHRLLDAELHNLYGPTEAAIDVTHWRTTAPPGDGSVAASVAPSVPIGRPIANLRIHLLDADLHPVPAGEPGELHIGGAGLARGYWRRPGLTAERFVPDPFAAELAAAGARLYRTGDLARHRAAGEIEFLGRLDQQVKIRGFRVELGEVEAALRAQPAVAEAAVVCRQDAGGEPRLVAYLVAAGGGRPAAGDLRRALLERLPAPMVPADFVLLDALPLTPNGKLDRCALPDPEEGRLAPQAAGAVARTPTEEALAELWAEVLGVEAVGMEAHFVELGGHSLLATRLVARILESFAVSLEVRTVFEAPTVEDLALRIEEEQQAGRRRELPPLRATGAAGPEMTGAQRRLWHLDRWHRKHRRPSRGAWNVVLAARLSGPLHAGAFAWGLEQVMRNQENLRTRFPAVAGEPHPVLEAEVELPLPLVDLGDLAPPDREAALLRRLRRLAERPFDLQRAPLAVARLFRLAPGEHALVLGMHSIVSDEWSLGTLLRDLSRFYFHRVDGCELPEPAPVQWSDYVRWRCRALARGDLAEQATYWRRRLSGAPPPLEWPLARARPTGRTAAAAALPLRLPEEVAAALTALARRRRASLSTLLLAALQLLLGRLAGRDEVVVGLPVAGRRGLLEVELLIGPFAHLLPLRTDLCGDPTFEELLERVRRGAREAHAHQDVDPEELAEAELLDAAPEHRPSPRVVFALEVVRPQPTATLDISPLRFPRNTTRFDLSLAMRQEAGVISGSLTYDAGLFEEKTIEEVIGRYQDLLRRIAADPTRRLSVLGSP